jgi:hypothetical protein
MNAFFADSLNEKQREIYENTKSLFVGLSYAESKEILTKLLSDLGKQAMIANTIKI